MEGYIIDVRRKVNFDQPNLSRNIIKRLEAHLHSLAAKVYHDFNIDDFNNDLDFCMFLNCTGLVSPCPFLNLSLKSGSSVLTDTFSCLLEAEVRVQ